MRLRHAAGLLAVAALTVPFLGAAAEEDVEALLARVQEQLSRLDAATAERDQALRFLEQQVEAAAGALSATGETAEGLRARAAALSTTVDTLAQDRQQLATRLETVEDERDGRIRELEVAIAGLNDMLGGTTRRVASLESTLADRQRGLDAAAAELVRRDAQLQARAADVARLSALLGRATDQLRHIQGALDGSQAQIRSQQEKIEDLGERLSQALVRQVEELARYRSEFFGRLGAVLGARPDVRVVGDRFVFPSELLFASGSAELGPDGRAQLAALARTLSEVAATIPADIDWVLRVDGHTDRRPVRSDGPFRSNWELSTARAIAVVEALVEAGVPPRRLAAAGFGEHKPLDAGEGELAFQRNRRIELKLTEG